MNFITRYLVFILILLTASACGGGSDGGSGGVTNSPSETIHVDNSVLKNTDSIYANAIAYYKSTKSNYSACLACHITGGIAAGTRLILNRNDDTASVMAINEYVKVNDNQKLLAKTIANPFHGGGATFTNAYSGKYASLSQLLSLLDTARANETNSNISNDTVLKGLVTGWDFKTVEGNLIDDTQKIAKQAFLAGDISINDGVARFGESANGTGSITVPVMNIASKITDEITLSFWAKGSETISNNSIIYATDMDGNRLLNIHLPYGNTVYWDAGNGLNWDRISKNVAIDDLKARWVYWTFVKNALTGEMKIYLDGEEIVSATGKNRELSGINALFIGAQNQNGSNGYKGSLDTLRLYNKTLSAAEIRSEYQQGRTAEMVMVPPTQAPEPTPIPDPTPEQPVTIVDLDADDDGVVDTLDKYSNDASRYADQGYYYQRWNEAVMNVDALYSGDFLDKKANIEQIKTGTIELGKVADNYYHRVLAYIEPSETADYYFYVAADDGAHVWLSPDALPANKKRIIKLDRWTNANQFTKYSEQKSSLISLEKGKPYFIEIIAYEGGGDDNLSLAWSKVKNGETSSIQVIPADQIKSFYFPGDANVSDVLNDTDGDGIPNTADSDDDNDGVADSIDAFPLDANESKDTDGDGLGDNKDSDDDNDGVTDANDKYPTDPTRTGGAEDNVATFNKNVAQGKCLVCHSTAGAAKRTDLIFRSGNTLADINHNETQAALYINSVTDGGNKLLDKARGLKNHGGGAVIALGSDEYNLLKALVDKYTGNSGNTVTSDGSYVLESPAQTYRRASLYLTGEVPSRSKVLSMQSATDTILRNEILALMQGEGFHEFIKDGANMRLHSRHNKTSDEGTTYFQKYFKLDDINRTQVRQDLAEEPLELIAYVVENNLPYTEILTADYTMVSQYTDAVYKTGLNLKEGEWRKAKNKGHEIKTESTYNSDATGTTTYTDFPHAGVLSSWSYLSRYPTTPTNRNRARAAWTMRHFLGFDVEMSAARVLDLEDVADDANPILNNPACMSCHDIMDPVASSFQMFHERNGFKAFGTDSLDEVYRKANKGVTWYPEMLQAGYANEVTPANVDPLQWLAQEIVNDYRFAIGTVKFWWKPVFGEDVLSQSSTREHYNKQEALITTLANSFRTHMNLKQLLADMIMSDAYRVARKSDAALNDDNVSLHGGSRHLLSSYQLKNKTESLTGFIWGNSNPKLSNEYYSLYGGTDDVNVNDRPANLTSLMFNIAEKQAFNLGCAIVVNEFASSAGQRRLFTEVERDTVGDETRIRQQLVVLQERLLNRLETPGSVNTSHLYQLFLDLRVARVRRGGTERIFESGERCDNRKTGSDNDKYYVLGPWKNILTMMMFDADYLYE